MGDKFTIRDFFTYLLCGCCVYLCFFIVEYSLIKEFVKTHKEFFKDNSTLILFIGLPILYFTGHFLQSLDMLLYFLGREIRERINNPNITKKDFLKLIYSILSRHRVTGNLIKKEIDEKSFWTKCNALELASKYGHAEYSYIQNDMFKGLFILSLICSIYTFIQGHYYLTIFFCFATFLSWLRAIHYANIFVDTVNNTYKVLMDNREFEKKMKEKGEK
jgi:hypothetical protein